MGLGGEGVGEMEEGVALVGGMPKLNKQEVGKIERPNKQGVWNSRGRKYRLRNNIYFWIVLFFEFIN